MSQLPPAARLMRVDTTIEPVHPVIGENNAASTF